MKNKIAHKRKAATYFKVVSYILNKELKNSNVSFITVTDVELSYDNLKLKIFVCFEDNIKKSIETLNSNKVKNFIRTRLAKSVQQRKVPMIDFQYDTSFDKAQRIESILKEIASNK